METGPNDKYLSVFHIRRACEASLKRLKTDHIDLYQMTSPPRRCPPMRATCLASPPNRASTI